MLKVTYVAKTNINNDGRILNQIRILRQFYKDNLSLEFILFPDKPITIDFGKGVVLHEIKTVFRNNSLFRVLTVFEFTLKTILQLFRSKPDVIHAQDLAVVLPIYIYRLLKRKSFKLIYDDHEMPNDNESIQYKIFQYFETKLMKSADVVIFANEERLEVAKGQYMLKNKLTYFLNLPYFDKVEPEFIQECNNGMSLELEGYIKKGVRFIIHQGALEVERGREKLANFSTLLPDDVKILMLGISKDEMDEFVREYNLMDKNFYFIGSVPYNVLNGFWKLGSAAIVMYLPTYINNRLCAPNRFYIAVNHQLPVVVNRDNPVLNNFVNQYKSGFFIEDLLTQDDINKLLDHEYKSGLIDDLIQEEKKKLINIYENF